MSLPFIIFPLPGSMSAIFSKQVLDWREGEEKGYVRLWLHHSLSKVKCTSDFKGESVMLKGSGIKTTSCDKIPNQRSVTEQ